MTPLDRAWVGIALGASLMLGACGPSISREGPVRAVRAAGALPKTEPRSDAWNAAPIREVDMIPQAVTQPSLATPSIAKVRVQAMHDGQWIAFRLEWEDRTKDDVVGVARMADAIAVELPSHRGTPPSPMMGHEGGRVTILYWRAAWEGGDALAANYPNRPPTYYPSDPMPEGAARDRARKNYSPAIAVGNPAYARYHHQPGFRGEAEGFGTLSAAEQPEVAVRGEYHEGHWYVVLAMPIGAAGTSPVAPGQRTNVAFAAWDGSAGNVGPRKMWSGNWLDLEIVAGSS